jgi:DNA polymerase-3 subunit delta'
MTVPATTNDLLGHEAAEAALLAAVRSGRLHHGWLIAGPSGIGKATLAYRFARFLLAGAKGEGLAVNPSNPVAKRIAAGAHADLVVVERTQRDNGTLRDEIVVDDVRRIEPLFRRTSAEGGWRIVIIDEADRMNTAAQNAVLKILEEPPANALLLLTAEAPGRLLPTIRSRVRKLALQPLPRNHMETLLEKLLPGEDHAVLAALAEGSPGRALALHQAEGVTIYRELLAILNSGQPRLMLDFSEKLGRKGGEEGYAVLARLLPDWLASVAKLAATGEMSERMAGEGEAAVRLAQSLGLERSLALWDKVRGLFAQADGLNLDRKQVLLSALFAVRGAGMA